MIAAIRKKYQENKQNSSSSLESNHKYEYKEKFDCGKPVEMFPYCGGEWQKILFVWVSRFYKNKKKNY